MTSLAPRVREVARRWGDPVLAVLLALGGALELMRYPSAEPQVAVAAGVMAGLALAVRRRVPLITYAVMFGCLVVIDVTAPGFMGKSVVMVAVFMITLYSVGANATGVSAWLGGPAVILSVVALDLQDGDTSAAGIFFFVLFAGLPWATGLVIRLRIARVRELAASNAALQQEALRAVADERARIARELHDVVSHAIAVTILQARGARTVVGRDEAAARQALDAIEQTNAAALADMRRLLALLRTSDGEDSRSEPAPGLDRLDALAGQVRASGLPVEVTVTGDPLPLPPGLDLSAYRIVQEALTNVIKHAGSGARALVLIGYGADGLDLAVTDQGGARPGATTPVPGHPGHGLIGIRERATVAGGRAEVGPTADGFAVRVWLPYLVGAMPPRDVATADPASRLPG